MSRELIHKLLSETMNGMKASKEFRKSQERNELIQLINLPKDVIIKVSKDTLGIPDDVASNIYTVLHAKFTQLQLRTINKPSIKADPILSLKLAKSLELKQLSEYKDQFIIYNFRQAQEELYKLWGEEAFKYLQSTGSRKTQKEAQIALSSQKKGSGGAAIEHGGGLGAPLTGVQAFIGIQKFGEELGKLGVKKENYQRMLMDVYELSPAQLKLNVIYTTKMAESVEITDKNILGQYVFALSLGTAAGNIEDSGLERLAADQFRKLFFDKAVTTLRNSEYGKYIDDILVDSLYKDLFSNKNIKISGVKKGSKGTKQSNTTSSKITRQVSINTSSVSVRGTSKGSKGVSTPTVSSPTLNIVALLNAKLTAEIRKRMTYPRLVYRTGRFASSVKVTGSTKDITGQSVISYTYDKNPYQIFEQGQGRLPWATPARDPRTIIESSIREIAVGIIAGKFNLRRD